MGLVSRLSAQPLDTVFFIDQERTWTRGDLLILVEQAKIVPERFIKATDPLQTFAHALACLSTTQSAFLLPPTGNHQQVSTESVPNALWFQTSGTTGTPKWIGHTEHSLVAAWTQLAPRLTQQPSVWGLCLPVHHVGGFMVLVRQFLKGGQVLWRESATELVSILAEGAAISLVPAQLKRLLDQPSTHPNLQKLSTILLGGDALSPELEQRCLELSLPVLAGFGATETAGAVILKSCGDPGLGTALNHVQLTLDDQQHLVITAESIAPYQLIGDTLHHTKGVFPTKDRVHCDQEGVWHYRGRSDQSFQCGGELISPFELEASLKKISDLPFLILPRPHPVLGATPSLVLLDRARWAEGMDLFEQAQYLLGQLKAPRSMLVHTHAQSDHQLKINRGHHQQLVNQSVDAPELICLHGLFGDRHDFSALVSELVADDQETHPVLLAPNIDQDFKTKTELTSWLATMIKRYHHQGPTIGIGYSLGGRLLLEVHAAHPGLFDGLIILAAHPGLESSDERQQREHSDRALVQRLQLISRNAQLKEEFLDQWYAQPLFGRLREREEFPARKRRQLTNFSSSLSHFVSITALSQQPNLESTLENLPVLYCYGQEDQKFKALSTRYKSLGAQIEEIPGAAHALLLEAPEALAQVIKPWILQLTRAKESRL
jgi:2-succinyl-6-hydroxy-2,4-cyclohexadiene-1-carboxylate synthase